VEPQPARELIEPLFHWLKLDERARQFRALRAFALAAGPRIAGRARAEALRGPILFVRVSSSAWAHELHALKHEILDKLRRTSGGEQVAELRFSVGPLADAPAWEVGPVAAPPSEPEPAAPPPSELAQALGGVTDAELKDELSRLYARGGRRSPT
jgi:hypothetical protein